VSESVWQNAIAGLTVLAVPILLSGVLICVADDPRFAGGGSTVRYSIRLKGWEHFRVKAELWIQPVGYRWAHNLAPYAATESQRMVTYYETAAGKSAFILASAEATE
jgi:hypothetical protein